jgi:hypothetical protein
MTKGTLLAFFGVVSAALLGLGAGAAGVDVGRYQIVTVQNGELDVLLDTATGTGYVLEAGDGGLKTWKARIALP